MDPSALGATAPGQPRELDVRLGRAWRDNHRYLLDVAFRVLGSISEAEDVVQEAFARLVDVDMDEIDDVRGWLVVVVSRICFDQLRSARWKRQTATDAVPEPAPGLPGASADPADRVTLDDEVRLALHVLLAKLSPAERTAFVLHDVFKYSFDQVGEVVGRSSAACRQLAARARRRIRAEDDAGRFTVESVEQRRVTEQFMTACSTGDLEGLLEVLDPDVVGLADVGSLAPSRAATPVVGRDSVARRALQYLGPQTGTTLLSLPTGSKPTVLALRDDHVFAIFTLTLNENGIEHLDGLADPARLAYLDDVLDL